MRSLTLIFTCFSQKHFPHESKQELQNRLPSFSIQREGARETPGEERISKNAQAGTENKAFIILLLFTLNKTGFP